MALRIRREWPEEFGDIRALVREAFLTADHEGDEHDFVDRQRQGGGYLPELALVAESGGALVGHIIVTRIAVRTPGGERPLLLLAELAVALRHRRQGIASALIGTALAAARGLGFGAIVLVGDPAFYGRFGFRPSIEFGLENDTGIEPRYVQARDLRRGGLELLAGTLSLPR